MSPEARAQAELARRLGMPSLAEHIEKQSTVYIIPTAAAYYTLKAAGMLGTQKEDPPKASLGIYR